MPRPIWKGFITFGLVNIPVILYSAEKKFDIQFKLVDSRDKAKIHYVRVNEQTGEEVPWTDVAKGYQYDDDYVLVKENDLKKIAGEHSKTIDIENFVDIKTLNFTYFEKPYMLVPDKNGEKGYVLLREILKETGKVGIANVLIHSREYLSALIPYENALILNLLRYQQELRQPSEFELPEKNIKSYKISTKEMQIAKQLVDSMTAKWDPSEYHDKFREELKKWIENKIHHIKPKGKKKTRITRTNVVNFIELLKESVKKKKPTHTRGPKKPKRHMRKRRSHDIKKIS